jgi:parvulin-like peptidyl-prolyl isomerase
MMTRRLAGAFGFGTALVTLVACSGPPARPAAAVSPTPDPGAPPQIDRTTPLPSPLPDIVARVNGDPVRIQQVLGLAKKALRDSKDREKDMPGAVRQAMHQYVVRELLFQEAMARGISADTRQVEKVFDQVRSGFKDEQRWRESLADQGLDPQSYRQELRIQETVNALLAKVGEGIVVGDEEVAAFFHANPRTIDPGEKLRIRQILFRVPAGADDRVKEAIRVKAGLAAHRAQAGEDFAALVKEFSEEQETKKRGGQLEIGRGTMPPAFEQAAYALVPGQVSGLVETPKAIGILKLEERIPGPPASLDEVKQSIRADLVVRKRQAAYQALVNSLRAKARIETYL